MSTFSIISYIALGLTTLGLTWIFSSIGKNVKTEKNRGIEESRETPEEKEAGDVFVVLNKTVYKKTKASWYQVAPSGKLMSLNHLENYQQILQLLEEKKKEQIC